MRKQRLDDYLIANKMVKDKPDAFIKVTEGLVFIDGQKAISPAQLITPVTKIEMKRPREFVGRGAYKLEAAIQNFNLNIENKICADIGAATGGFTEILLKYGAKKVYAIDTTRGKLALKLREDARVVVMEETDVRALKKLPEEMDVVTIDVSLIPLKEILPHVKKFLKSGGEVAALLKPQYETRNPEMLKHGIVADPADREKILENFKNWALSANWKIKKLIESPIQGGKGNTEYLLCLEIKN